MIEGTNIKKKKFIIFCILFNFSNIDIKIVDEIVFIIQIAHKSKVININLFYQKILYWIIIEIPGISIT